MNIAFLEYIPLEIFIIWIGLLGLIVGSFLNVIIHRLPLMLEQDWKKQCNELLGIEENNEKQEINLIIPPSTCPFCGHQIRFYENIPILSYLFLGGKCSNCKKGIPAQYPLVEFLTAIISVVLVLHFGKTWQLVGALIFTWLLIPLSVIDLKKKILPDELNYILLWVGLILSLYNVFINVQSSIFGAVFGYLSLWTIYQVFKLLTGKEGMGHGDFKLLAALGAWIGWHYLPMVVLFSSLAGLFLALLWMILQENDPEIPFGPALALAGWVVFIWGEDIFIAYDNFLSF